MMYCNMLNVQQNSYLVVKMYFIKTRNHSCTTKWLISCQILHVFIKERIHVVQQND